MKTFFIYHSRAADPLATVHRIHVRAAARARQIAKAVAVVDVDLDTATGDVLGCYGRMGTIECVTADGANCKDRARNPSSVEVNNMIDRV